MNRKWKLFSHIVNDIPLKYKFLFIYLLCVLLPIMSINILFYVQNSRDTQSRERENLQISLDRAAYELTQIVNESVAIGNTVAADRTFNEKLEASYSDLSIYYETYDSYLRDKLRPYTDQYPYISWLGVFTTNPTIGSGGSYFVLKDSDKQSEWYRKLTDTKEKVIVSSYLDINPMNPQQKRVYVSIIRKLENFPDLVTYTKYLRVDLQLDKLQELLKKEQNYLQFKLVDANNRVVLDSNLSYIAKENLLPAIAKEYLDSSNNKANGNFISNLGTASYLSGWKLIGIPEQARFQQKQNAVIKFGIILTLCSTVIPTVLVFTILQSYNLRVRRLSKHMQWVKNERFEPINMYEGKDEIGGLLRSFNLMTVKIRNLINDVYKLEIQKKDLELERVRAELNYLQSQVDPHFLFNTLNAILVVCKKHRYEHVTDIIRSLSQILRRLLSWKDDLVTIEEEISFINMYLQIEKFRFQDRFSYEVDIDPRILSCRIPKMSIQTLVENACKHGLQSVKGDRRIHISAGLDDRYLIIKVKDNGIGMDTAKLNSILQNLHVEEDEGKNIGLRNVYKRLNLFYKDRSLFLIDSKAYEQTSVTILIPIRLILSQEEAAAHD
ncbi:two-component sensor histidine kinase [Paenibacillus sp. 5J-6]|uniref:Two-component sensor histidine kinase n=1 Tax=Paenibacillus silvestris TaxID=2606219 RepID=A0A6L8V522_9BACL|nr:histidine kinase [Paenibacillus silvestris]MZQ85478.1 two-component sensor histidine kinase [Paenibacillus silvestris]